MREELGQLDADLKGLFMENKVEEMYELLKEQPDDDVQDICEYSWDIVKKYYEAERFDLLFQHIKFVAFTCCIVEYAYRMQLMEAGVFESRMKVFHDLYERMRHNQQ